MYEEQVLILSRRGAVLERGGQRADHPQMASREPLFAAAQHSAPPPHRLGDRAGALRHRQQLPLVMNVYNSPDFVFNVAYEFTDRFADRRHSFSNEARRAQDKALPYQSTVQVTLSDTVVEHIHREDFLATSNRTAQQR